MATTETFEFKAETSQLLNLVINSLYTNKDIFLRELISNASDALDRLRFEAITTPDILPDGHDLGMRIEYDRKARTLTLQDSGVGMGRDEVITNIGTIAKSGTRELLQQAAEKGDRDVIAKLIGQFGVGFYSVFMVADKVSLLTRRAGEEGATFWESVGQGRFDVRDASRPTCGTTITLHLKPVDEEAGIADFTDPQVLQRIVKRYSDFITHPIVAPMERTEYERNEDGSIKEGSEPKTIIEDTTLNAMKPIWTRPKSEVKDEEYSEFYRHVAHDWTDPLKTISLKAEGRLEYRSLLFIPSKAPFDFGLSTTTSGLQLYAKSVMIMENCEDLLAPYLRFVRGIVDSADLPLNVSRETLQQDRHITQIRKWLTFKILKELEDMKDKENESYLKFWSEFGRILKEGTTSEVENLTKLQGILLFESSNDKEALTSLADYIGRMKDDQEEIYYLTGESRAVIEVSPHLEAFIARGYEVLYLSDPVDEVMVQFLTEFEGKKLRSAAKGSVDLGSEEERKQKREELDEKGKEFSDLLTTLQKHLEKHVKEVRLSNRLTTSPACLVGAEHDMSPQLEKLLRQTRQEVPHQLRILELNPEHVVVKKLIERSAEDKDDQKIAEISDLLYGYALLAEGSDLPDPARFNALLIDLMSRNL